MTKSVISPMQRHRLWRLPVIRGVVALGESLAIGFRALAISPTSRCRRSPRRAPRASRRGLDRDLARPDHRLVRDRDRLRAGALQGRTGAAHELAADRRHLLLRRRRGPDPGGGADRLHRPDRPAARSEARLRVPRRRAQGDQRARGRLRADAREGAEVQLDPPSLRNCFFAMGHGDRDLRLRARRTARLVLAHHQPDPPAAGDRRPRLRADPLRRASTRATAS